jgi:hypothetical protein
MVPPQEATNNKRNATSIMNNVNWIITMYKKHVRKCEKIIYLKSLCDPLDKLGRNDHTPQWQISSRTRRRSSREEEEVF